jgi:hypothetical protein
MINIAPTDTIQYNFFNKNKLAERSPGPSGPRIF